MIRLLESAGKLSSSGESAHAQLIQLAIERMRQGLSPPREIHQVHLRGKINWLQFPAWARPADPDLFDNCCHEG